LGTRMIQWHQPPEAKGTRSQYQGDEVQKEANRIHRAAYR